MICVRLMGGLGNQMFQYAAGRRLALARRTRLVLDCSWFVRDAQRAATPRAFELDCFDLPAERAVLEHETIAVWEWCDRHPLRSRVSRHAFRKRVVVLRGDGGERPFDPAVLDAPGSALLIGYWQSPRYFGGVESQIRDDFRFALAGTEHEESLLAEIRTSPAVSIHVRRGDYVGSERFTALPAAYYRDAVAAIAERTGSPHLYVFSDDVPWCREHLELPFPTVFVERPAGHPGGDLRLMSSCRHHVISNSTFGWWGAWLNPSREKIVVAPRRWFREPAQDPVDIVPAGWLQI